LRTARPIVEEGFWSRIVEAMNPVAQGLAIHSADLGGLAAVHSVPNRSQRQKPSALTRVLRPPGQSPKLLSRIIFPQFHRCWHARILQPITSQKIRALGIPNESAGKPFGIKALLGRLLRATGARMSGAAVQQNRSGAVEGASL